MRSVAESRRMSGKQGFTLLEMMIVVVIFAAVMASALSVLMTGQEAYNVGAVQTAMENEALRIMDLITENIPESWVITSPQDSNNYLMLGIRVPVVSGTAYWNKDGIIYWGAADNQGWSIRYLLVENDLETLGEAADQRDYNRDGDMNDIFARGNLVMQIFDAGEILQQGTIIGRNIIVMPEVDGDYDGDINNDGEPDPIFVKIDETYRPTTIPPYNDNPGTGNRIRINLWLCRLGPDGEPILVNSRTDVALLNPQQ